MVASATGGTEIVRRTARHAPADLTPWRRLQRLQKRGLQTPAAAVAAEAWARHAPQKKQEGKEMKAGMKMILIL